VVMHVSGGNEWQPGSSGERDELREPCGVIRAAEDFRQQVGAIAEEVTVSAEGSWVAGLCRRQYAGNQTFRMLGDVGEGEMAFSLCSSSPSQGEQARQPSIRAPVGRPDHNRRCIRGMKLRSDEQFQAGLLGG
jgi:hypothetical protein